MKASLMSDFELSFPSEAEIVMTRTLNAPRSLVFGLWSAPQHVRHWWGPQGFENLKVEMDFRVGGRFLIEMRAPDGEIYPCEGTYKAIVPDARIVYEGAAHIEHACGAGLPPLATVEITFKDEVASDGSLRTRLILHARLISAKMRDDAVAMGFADGWADSFDRLETELDDPYEIISARLFDASRDDLFALFANPEHLANWWGPDEFSNRFDVFDLKTGGDWRFAMIGPDGREHYNTKIFVEVTVPERVVADHIQPQHLFRMTMDYIARGPDQTELVWRMKFVPETEMTMLKAFIPGANQQNFNRLQDLIDTQNNRGT